MERNLLSFRLMELSCPRKPLIEIVVCSYWRSIQIVYHALAVQCNQTVGLLNNTVEEKLIYIIRVLNL